MSGDPIRRPVLQAALFFTVVLAGLLILTGFIVHDALTLGGAAFWVLAVVAVVVVLMNARVTWRCWRRYQLGESYRPRAN